jgi:DNA-binding NtrC family response regulator
MLDAICLIATDEPAVRAYLRAILHVERFQSLEASSAAQALRILQKLDGRLDLLLSDLRLPGDMNGLDLAWSVHSQFPAVPVILLAGYDREEALGRIREFEVIQKPFVPETIQAAARQALRSRHVKATHGGAPWG